MHGSARTLVFSITTFVLSTGCNGPLAVPMVSRLEPEAQEKIEQAWDNMLMPVDRLDRTLLLDVIMLYQLHSSGVDRLHMTSEKYIDGAMVLMEVDFDRDDPDGDVFTVTIIDDDGSELRRESYSPDEMTARIDALYKTEMVPDDFDEGYGVDEETETAREARMEEIYAATQPAVDP